MLAFIHIEKAAGSTIIDILRRSCRGRHVTVGRMRRGWSVHSHFTSAADLRRVEELVGPLLSVSGHGIKPCSDLEEYRPGIRYFTMFREPLARCISHYQYQWQHMNQRLSFARWLKVPGYRNF